ncbi:MAG: CHC2 zinc finger domain-containing protein [Syntrophorhabdaceae bacterium]|nr:CHC2 zinc finger domain-containing protein [Syntrophorhabdaceae bacterium]
MPDTRKKISELISEASPELKRNARIEYLKAVMEDIVCDALYAQKRFDSYLERRKTVEAILEKETLDGLIKKISKLQAEIISLRKPEKPESITEDMIRRAKEYPFADLHEFKRNQAACPFHADKDPSMRLYPDNHVYCFSCGKGWDTIGFVMDRDGLTFPEAVKRMN